MIPDLATTPPADLAAWFVARMDSGAWGPADEAALQAWLRANPRAEGLLLRTQALWLAHVSPAATTPADREPTASDPIPADLVPATGWNRRRLLGGLAAASVAGVAGWAGMRRWLDYAAGYSTRIGEIRRVPLADGSVMTINSASELKVQFEATRRQVELSQGEAWFDVAKDVARPFIVSAGKVRAQAVGTAFSVRVRPGGVEVLVTEGTVETWRDDSAGPRVRLTAGHRALVSAGAEADVHFEAAEPSSVDRALAWRGGMIDLDGITLGDAAAEFNRYNERHIVIADPDVAAEQLDGLFRVNDPEGFALAVKSSLDVNVNMNDPKFIRIDRPAQSELTK